MDLLELKYTMQGRFLPIFLPTTNTKIHSLKLLMCMTKETKPSLWVNMLTMEICKTMSKDSEQMPFNWKNNILNSSSILFSNQSNLSRTLHSSQSICSTSKISTSKMASRKSVSLYRWIAKYLRFWLIEPMFLISITMASKKTPIVETSPSIPIL